MQTIPEQIECWRAFLSTIAPQVNALIINPTNLATFRERITPFAERWKKHVAAGRHAEEARIRHWQQVKRNPQWRDKMAQPPRKGWEWDRSYVGAVGSHAGVEYEIPPEYVQDVIAAVEQEIERVKSQMRKCPEFSGEYNGLVDYLPVVEQDLVDLHAEFDRLSPAERTTTWVKAPMRHHRSGRSHSTSGFQWFSLLGMHQWQISGCWRPPMKKIPEDPCQTLRPDEATRRLPASRNQADEYERYYVTLASIHDNILPSSESITKPLWAEALAREVWHTLSVVPRWGPDQAFIEVALNRVKADLDKQNKSPNGPALPRENAGGAARGGSRSEAELVGDGVFISYSHKDKKWFGELQDHLKPYTRKGSVTEWSDEVISTGQEWFAQIKAALASAKVAVLLVSKDFLASEFIAENELRPLLEQARIGVVQIIWIPLGACSYKETELQTLQAPIDPDKPLANMRKQDRDKAWVKICEAIKEAVTR